MSKPFQSTRPRGARPQHKVSECRDDCFNPRALAGRDVMRVDPFPKRLRFNPRALAGRDGTLVLQLPPPTYVSIHAPSRGATRKHLPMIEALVFQSTRPRGARLTSGVINHPIGMFQSTRPRGARLIPIAVWPAITSCFNPRALAGRDELGVFGLPI